MAKPAVAALAHGSQASAGGPADAAGGQPKQRAPSRPQPQAGEGTAPLRPRFGYLHIGRDWRITYAHLEGGTANERTGEQLMGQVLWDLYPHLAGTPFEKAYRDTMADRTPRTFEAVYEPAGMRLENRLFPAGDGIALYYEDVSRRRMLEDQLSRRNRQQEAVARLGQAALEGADLGTLLDQAVREAADALEVEFAKFVEPTGDGKRLLLRAGVGWRAGVVGKAALSAEGGSQAGYALQAHGPVTVTDLARETRFTPPSLFLEHGIASGLSVLVGPRDTPYGVLGAHSRQARDFTQDDINFMQAVANLLGAAIQRARVEGELRRHRDDLEGLVHDRTRRLESTNRDLEAFSYSVSHDLRTPLRAIAGFSQLILRHHGTELSPGATDLLDKVQGNAERMGELIESLLTLSRLGRKELSPDTVDLSALARLTLDGLAAASPQRRASYHIEPGLRARGDPDLLLILLENLLGNAWKFTSLRPKARIEVGRVEASRDPMLTGQEAFYVRDNGAGFDMAHAAGLFQPFHRLHAGDEFEGTGVGLATVHRIVHRHGGRVWAEARPDKGAAFFFTLPSPQPGALPASSPSAPATLSTPPAAPSTAQR